LTERFRADVFVRSPRRGGLTKVLSSMGATVVAEPGGGLSVTGMESWKIASAAAEHHIPIQELIPRSAPFAAYYPDLARKLECLVSMTEEEDADRRAQWNPTQSPSSGLW
jgi:hypothetical protein